MTDNALQKIKVGRFIRNNGVVIRRINILRTKYISLLSVWDVVKGDGLDEGEYLDSINFLQESKYIHLRHCGSKHDKLLCDSRFTELEAKLTEKGIRLLGGEFDDKMVDV